jgi:hypothetical protein
MLKRAMTVVGVLFFVACADSQTGPRGSIVGDTASYEDGEGSLVEVRALRESDRFEVRYVTPDGEEHYAVFERGDRAAAAEFLSEMRSPLLQVAGQLGREPAADANLWVMEVVDPDTI